MVKHIGLVCTSSPSRFRWIGPSVKSSTGQTPGWLGTAVMSTGAANGTVVVCPLIVAVAIPVAVSTPFTSERLVIVGTMLMLLAFGAASASGRPPDHRQEGYSHSHRDDFVSDAESSAILFVPAALGTERLQFPY